MVQERFGTADDYARALRSVLAKGVPEKHLGLLRAHFEAPRHTLTARQLAKAVGYANFGAVNMQYSKFAERVAAELGVLIKPPEGFWVFVLADWAKRRDPSGDTAFVLRPALVQTLKREPQLLA